MEKESGNHSGLQRKVMTLTMKLDNGFYISSTVGGNRFLWRAHFKIFSVCATGSFRTLKAIITVALSLLLRAVSLKQLSNTGDLEILRSYKKTVTINI